MWNVLDFQQSPYIDVIVRTLGWHWLTVEGANCFCHCGSSCHLICKMLCCRRSPLWACSLCCSKYSSASLLPAPDSFLSKIEQRGPTSFQFTFMSPFRWYRKWKRLTDVFNHWGFYGGPAARLGSVCGRSVFPSHAWVRWLSWAGPQPCIPWACSAPRQPATCFLQGQVLQPLCLDFSCLPPSILNWMN